MNTTTKISKKHGAMQINKDTFMFWFDQSNSGMNGSWFPITVKSIDYWTGKQSPLTKADKEWFKNSI